MRRLLLAALILVTPAFAYAQEEEEKPHDAEGCKDSPLLSRMPGSLIVECSDKEYDEPELPAGKDKEGTEVIKTFQGATTRLSYAHKKGQSSVQIVKNYEEALKRAGFKTSYAVTSNSQRTLTMQRAGKGASVVTVIADDYSPDNPTSQLTIVKLKEMEQEIVADASSLLDELNKSGRVAVYGINFDSGKATITDGSAKALGEVAKLLADNPDLKLRVEGHTDNVGKGNLELSKKRAAAVKEWLVKNGAKGERLTAEGFGDKKPEGDNKTEEGRAKNRRVELVKT